MILSKYDYSVLGLNLLSYVDFHSSSHIREIDVL